MIYCQFSETTATEESTTPAAMDISSTAAALGGYGLPDVETAVSQFVEFEPVYSQNLNVCLSSVFQGIIAKFSVTTSVKCYFDQAVFSEVNGLERVNELDSSVNF